MKLINDDCLKALPTIPDKSINLILTDPPYGTTACKWDSVIPFSLMWLNLKRIIKDNGCVALFGSEPFSSYLRTSNIEWFKYDWYWNKKIPSGMAFAKYQPMRQIELISIFSKNKIYYYPQKILRDKPIKSGGIKRSETAPHNLPIGFKKEYKYKNPINLIIFDKIRRGSVHPTQKPVPLLEYLIKTYTNENDTVLDFTMGSGSTGVACKNLNREFTGIELDKKYFDIAKNRINSILI
jgi:site-specific DNA-methyltransferase (adenine-specific)